jgi:farnesol dehydrogenase
MEAVNVEAPRALFALARELSIPRILYTSSFMALGPSDGEPSDERAGGRRDHYHNDYERTKTLGNEVALAAQREGTPLVILYPTVIFGPGSLTDGNHVGKIIRDYLKGRLPGRLGRGSALWNYAYVDDVVNGHLLALDRARPGSRYILGGENVTMNGFLEALEAASGVPPPARRIPKGVAKALAFFMELASRWTGTQPALTRAVVDIYERDWAYSSRLAMDELGYQPTPFREALGATVAWARGEGAR